MGHDPRLHRSDTVAPFALFADYYFRPEPSVASERRKFGLARCLFECLGDLTQEHLAPSDVLVTNLCNSPLPRAPRGKAALIREREARQGIEQLETLLALGSIHLIFAMSQQVRLDDFECFTDTFFWEQFRRVRERKGLSACGRLLRREKLQYVYTARDRAKFIVNQKVRQLEARLKCKIVLWESDTKFSKLGEPYEALRVVVRDRTTGKRHVDEVRSKTSFFGKFSRTKVVHFFKRSELTRSAPDAGAVQADPEDRK